MRTRSVDAYKVLEQLREGLTASAIAAEQGVTRQAINVWRKKFIEQGILEKPKRGRSYRGIAGVSGTKVEGLISQQFDRLSTKLTERISKLEDECATLHNRIKLLERFLVLREQSDITPERSIYSSQLLQAYQEGGIEALAKIMAERAAETVSLYDADKTETKGVRNEKREIT